MIWVQKEMFFSILKNFEKNQDFLNFREFLGKNLPEIKPQVSKIFKNLLIKTQWKEEVRRIQNYKNWGVFPKKSTLAMGKSKIFAATVAPRKKTYIPYFWLFIAFVIMYRWWRLRHRKFHLTKSALGHLIAVSIQNQRKKGKKARNAEILLQ